MAGAYGNRRLIIRAALTHSHAEADEKHYKLPTINSIFSYTKHQSG